LGIYLEILPSFGLGFAVHFEYAIFELILGPFLVLIGDVESYQSDD
jgi:hypothetical protein